jgi:HlyD family secretion protein
MKRSILVGGILVCVIAGGVYYARRGDNAQASEQQAAGGQANQGRGNAGGGNPGGFGGGGGFGGFGGGGGGGGQRLPMTVELASVKRADMASTITVVGNLVGAATVAAVPKVAGRLETVAVRLGDRVSRGQTIAKIEDREIQEQVKQAQASYDVSSATIRQREADLKLAQTNLDRSRNLYERELIPKQTFDDTDARYQAAVAQLDLANAQFAQARARLDELKINLANTLMTSPVSGFVGSRALDPGAWVTPNSVFISVVDISFVRLVASVVEKDIRRITQGLQANVEVDAFPGDTFEGRVAHIAPVLDPATRTAQIEVEIPNPQFRLKPGMYAKVSFTVDKKANTLVIPTTALVDVGGNRGVFLANEAEQGQVASFKKIEVGLMDQTFVEVIAGLSEGDRVVTTGAAALREGDRILLSDEGGTGANGLAGDGRAGRAQGADPRGSSGQGAVGGARRGGAGSGVPRGPNAGGARS